MPVPNAETVVVAGQELERVVADRLEHAEPIALPHHEAGPDQRVHVLPCDAHGLGGVGLEPAGEHAEVAEGPAPVSAGRRSTLHAMVARSACWRPDRSRGPSDARSSARGEVVRHLVEGHLAHPCRRQLDGERQPVEPGADPFDRRRRGCPSKRWSAAVARAVKSSTASSTSSGPSWRTCSPYTRSGTLLVTSTWMPSPGAEQPGHQRPRPSRPARSCRGGAGARRPARWSTSGVTVSSPTGSTPRASAIAGATRPGVVEVRELDEPHAVGAGAGHLVGQVQRQSGLAHPAGPRQRQQPGAVGEQPGQLVAVGTAADQRGRRRREVAAGPEVGVLEPQGRVVAEDRRVQVAQRGARVETGLLGQATPARRRTPPAPRPGVPTGAGRASGGRAGPRGAGAVRTRPSSSGTWSRWRPSASVRAARTARRSRRSSSSRAASGSITGTSRRSCHACPLQSASAASAVATAASWSPARCCSTHAVDLLLEDGDVEASVRHLEPVGPADRRQPSPPPARARAAARRRTPGGCAAAGPGRRPARARRPAVRRARRRAPGRAAHRGARAAWRTQVDRFAVDPDLQRPERPEHGLPVCHGSNLPHGGGQPVDSRGLSIL